MVWYSHLLKNFPQFIVIHTVKGFGVVNKADVFWNSVAFFPFALEQEERNQLFDLIKNLRTKHHEYLLRSLESSLA